MYEYLQALERTDGQAFIANEELIYALAFETNRWRNELGTLECDDETAFYPVSLYIDQTEIFHLYAEDGEHLWIPPIRVKSPEQFESVLGKLVTAYSDEVSLEEGSSIINGLLTQLGLPITIQQV